MTTSEPVVIPLVIDGKTIVPTMTELRKELNAAKKEQDGLTAGSKEFEAAGQRVKQLQGKLEEQTEATKKSREEGSKLNDTLRGLGPVGNTIADIRDKFSGVKDSAAQSVTSFRNVGIAMAAIPIIAIIAGFTALVQYFKKTDEGATRLEGIMGALKITVGLLTKPLIDLGKFLFEAFDNPKKAAQTFVDFLKDQVINRLNAVMVAGEAVSLLFQGKFTEAAKKAADAAIQLTLGVTDGTAKLSAMADEIGRAATEAYNLAAAFDDLADRERDFQVVQKETENQINRLLLQSKNRSLSEEERLALLNQASALEEKLHQQELGFARESLALIQQENAALRATGEDTDAMAEKETAAKVKLLELDGASLELQEKISNRRAALEQQIEAEAAKELAALEKLREGQDKYAEEQAKAAEKARQDKLDAIDAQAEEESIALEQAYFGKIDQQMELERKLYTIQRKALEEKRDLIKGDDTKSRQERNKIDTQILKADSELAAKELEIERKTAQAKEKIGHEKASAAQGFLKLGIDLLSQDEESRKKYSGAIKALAIGDMTVDYFKQLSAIGVFSMANPLNGVTFGGAGIAQQIIFTALATARYAFGVGQVIAQKFERGGEAPSFNYLGPIFRSLSRGGEIHGSRHGARYGDSGIAMIDRRSGYEVGEMEGGEGILTRGVMLNPKLRSMASAINVAAGGRSFMQGGAEDGSQGPGSITPDYSGLFNTLVDGMERQNAAISKWATQIEVINMVGNTTNKQNEMAKMVENATI
jgi:hypothetical protein